MAIRDDIIARDEQLDLLEAFLHSETDFTVKSLLVWGAPSTGKSLTVRKHLNGIKAKYTWVNSDECVSLKIMLQRIINQFQLDSGLKQRNDLIFDAFVSESFDNFITAMQQFVKNNDYREQHYLVLDNADLVIENPDSVFTSFLRFDEMALIENVSIIYITNSIPKRLITSSIPTIYFQQYTIDEVIRILQKNRLPECQFSETVTISTTEQDAFWFNYVKLIVDSYSPYTTNIELLKRIMIKLWGKFINKVEQGLIKPTDFLKLYRENVNLLASDYAISDNLEADDENYSRNDDFVTSLPLLAKYLIISGYLASFVEAKYDWILFSKLKSFHKKKQQIRGPRRAEPRLNSRLLDPASFELERLLAIVNAIYLLETSKKLVSNVDLYTQLSNLADLKIFLRSNNNDPIDSRTRWKINVNFDFVKNISDEINFPITNYLVEQQ